MIAIHTSRQQEFDVDLKAMQQINFTGYLDWGGEATMFFMIEEPKETDLDFLQGTVKVF